MERAGWQLKPYASPLLPAAAAAAVKDATPK